MFDTVSPTFIWSSDALADDYVIRIYMGSSTDIQDTLSDTTYAMSESLFETLLNGTYNWAAAAMSEDGGLFWSESRSFVIDKPEEPQGLGLDTTYFPFGLGYEWVFMRHEWGYDETLEPPLDYDVTCSFKIQVKEKFNVGDDFYFVLTIEPTYYFVPLDFFDLKNTVIVRDKGKKIEIKKNDWQQPIEIISVIPSEDISEYSFKIQYYDDTLCISYRYVGDFEYGSTKTKRKIGTGTINQSKSSYGMTHSGLYWDYEVRDTLLYLYNGQDTVYKAD